MRRAFSRCLGAAILLLTACGPPRQGSRQIAVISLTGGQTYWVDYQHAVARVAAASGYSVTFAAPQSEMDYQAQADMVREAIGRHVGGIIIAPQHQLVLASVLRLAHQAGIPVVTAGTPIALAPSDYSASVQWDNAKMGVLAADRVIALLHGRGAVAVIGVSPTLEVTSDRERAFERELVLHSAIRVATTKYGLSDWARSRQATLDALHEAPLGHPIRAIFASDEFSTVGVLGALRGLAHRPVFVGVGQESDTKNALRRGDIDALIMTSPAALGEAAMGTMQAVMEHKPYRNLQLENVSLLKKPGG